jgi:hypothetical protein
MPIRTQPSKSGQKRFHKRRTKATFGELDGLARGVMSARQRGLTRGTEGLRDAVKVRQNAKAGRARVVKGNRRRRTLP